MLAKTVHNKTKLSIMDDEGRKRRLPSWMTGVAAADQATKSEKENKSVNNNNVEQGIAPKSLCPKSKSKTGIKHIEKGVSLLEEELSEANSCALVKCGTERQRKNINQEEDAGSDFENLETAAEQKRSNRGGRKVRKCALRKQRKAESSRSKSSEEIEAPSPGENDGELTVDDLMSIAHEVIFFSFFFPSYNKAVVSVFQHLNLVITLQSRVPNKLSQAE